MFYFQLFWENLGIVIFKTEFLFLPNEFYILFSSSKSTEQPIKSDIYRASMGFNSRHFEGHWDHICKKIGI